MNKIAVIIDLVILLEVANVLRKLGIKDIEEEISVILSLPITVADLGQEDIVNAVKNYGLSPYDSLHYVVSKKYNAKIISANKDFKDRIDSIEF